jgi:hypothetical protein
MKILAYIILSLLIIPTIIIGILLWSFAQLIAFSFDILQPKWMNKDLSQEFRS